MSTVFREVESIYVGLQKLKITEAPWKFKICQD